MTPLAPGEQLAGKYEIIRRLGRGGFGAVYLATQHPVGREVAIKVIAPERAHDPQLAKRFFREARVIARLRHPSTVTLHDYGVEGGRLYMVMEYIEGLELSRVIRAQAPLAPGRVVALTIQAAGALAEAHGLNLVHRDIKPANVMVTHGSLGEEQLKLLDFGIAKLLDTQDSLSTRTGLVIGTPAYMSPEQSVGRGVGPWTDQYALGVVMYQMLTGRKLFAAPSALEVLNAHRTRPVPAMSPALDVPPELEIIVRRALSKAPLDRFPDMASMARALRTVAVVVPDDTHASPPMQEQSTVRGIEAARSEPLWSATGATSLEMRGTVAPTTAVRRGSRSHALLAMLLTGAAGTGVTAALLAVERPDAAPVDAGPDIPSRITLGTPVVDAAVPDAEVDATPPPVDATPPPVDATPEPPKARKRRRATRQAPRPALTETAPVPSPAPPRPLIVPVDPPPKEAPARAPRKQSLDDYFLENEPE